MIFSADLEKHVLAGLLKHKLVYHEISSFISESDFGYDINKTIFRAIRKAYENDEDLNHSILIGRIKLLNLVTQDNIDPADYIDALKYIQCTESSIKQAVADLKKLSKRRDFIDVAEKIKKQMVNDSEMSYEDIQSFVDKTFYSEMNHWDSASDSIDLFESMFERAFEKGANPVEEMGWQTPHKRFNERYGGFMKGNVYVFCARPKQGKTSFLDSTAFKMSNINNRLPCLILDTEMQDYEIGDRLLSTISGVNLWHITTGNWSRNKEMVDKIKRARALAEQKKYNLYHEYVINCPLEKIISKIKRWYYTKVGRGNPCIIVYDYIKLTGENLSGHYKEYQAIGDKITGLKDLVGKEINAPLLTSLQLNRQGEYKSGEQNDDASAIALSDRALWFASYVGIFRRKNFKELEEEGTNFGTHKLITIESRWQGKSSFGHHDFVKKPDGSLARNFVNFDLQNFDAIEHSGADEMYQQISVNNEVEKSEKPEESGENNPFEV